MWPVKCVQSIECGGDGYFICILLFLGLRPTFPLFLGLCSMVFSIGLRSFEGCVSILGVLGHSSFLGLVVVLSYLPRGFFDSVFWGVLFWHWSLLVHSCLGFSSSHNIVADRMIMKFKLFIPLIINTLYYTKNNANLKHFQIAYLL